MQSQPPPINNLMVHPYYPFAFLGCGSVANNTLKSPGYPDNYPNYTECKYYVPIPRNMTMNISFVDFEVEDHGHCM